MYLSDKRKDLGRIKETSFSDGEKLELNGSTLFFNILKKKGSNTFSWDIEMYETQRQWFVFSDSFFQSWQPIKSQETTRAGDHLGNLAH